MTTIVVNVPGAKLLSSKGAGANCSDHPQVRAKEKAKHRAGANTRTAAQIQVNDPRYQLCIVGWTGNGIQVVLSARDRMDRPFPARRVVFTRICPRRYFCDEGDNLPAMLKPTRDGVADALGRNDKDFVLVPPGAEVPAGKVGVHYEQVDGPWGLRITIET